jgi:hypothetical protein
MADPVLTTCTQDAWTKVATNVTAGVVHIINRPTGIQFLQTYRDTGGAAPSGSPGEEAVLIEGNQIDIQSSAGIDAYIYARGAAGRVRVDL